MLSNYPQLRYCKILKGKKAPFEIDWTNKPYTWEEMQEHISKETNYGVLCGFGNLAVIDCDNVELQKHIEATLPATFRVRTGGGGTHNYFFVPELQKKIVLTTNLGDKEIHWGEVQSKGTQVVGAGSIHPNGNEYKTIAPVLIAEITQEQLLAAVRPFMKEIQQSQRMADWEGERYGKKIGIDSLNVADIWGTAGLKSHGSEYYGSHPTHGSESGMNFWLNPSRNLWHCFRCNSGGGALSAIAVKEGVIDCSEAQKGQLRGASAIESIKLAKEKYGLKEELSTLSTLSTPQQEEFSLIWDKDLANYEEEEREWIIDKLIPSCSVGVWTGKRATYKTFLALEAVYAIASGMPFCNAFPVKQCKVLYLDKENGIPIIKQRVAMIKKGKEMTANYEVGFICFSTLKLDKPKDIKQLEELIKKEQPKVLFIDTYRRAICFDENDAGEVSKLFVDILRPLVEKYKITIVLIHHDKKYGAESGGDEMDEIRGSSDLANYADFILKNKRTKEKRLILEQIKNRNAPEIPPMSLSFETDDETYFKFKNEGEFVPQTKDERCAEILYLWIFKNHLKSFKTVDAKEIAFQQGVKKRNFFYGMKLLEERGLIQQRGYGEYDVKEQTKLDI
jgi:RecA-family ATPase